jgi:hypothetical protein
MAIGRNDYAERKEERIDRLTGAVQALNKESQSAADRAEKLSERFYMGQPIIVGHHSEKSARSDQSKMWAATARSFDLADKAAEIAAKAEAAENNRAISLDNPDAPELLQAKIEKLEKELARRKEINKYFRKHKTCVGCPDMDDETAKSIDEGVAKNVLSDAPSPSYTLTSLNQRIKTAKKRLEQLAALDEMPAEIIVFDGGEIEVDLDENRVKIRFDKRQSDEMTDRLKSRGFKWSHNNQCWQRLRNKSALWAAKWICKVTE